MRANFPYKQQVAEFRSVFGRDPADDDELDAFVDELTREMYNSGEDFIAE